MSCGFNGGHCAAASVVTVTLGAKAGHVPVEGRCEKEARSSLVCQVNLFPGSLFSFSSNPSLFLFYHQLPSSVERFYTQLPPSMERYAEHSRAGRTLPEGNAVTFCMLSLLPIRGFLSKNANRPEIECLVSVTEN